MDSIIPLRQEQVGNFYRGQLFAQFRRSINTIGRQESVESPPDIPDAGNSLRSRLASLRLLTSSCSKGQWWISFAAC
jgi:hypothetical protein